MSGLGGPDGRAPPGGLFSMTMFIISLIILALVAFVVFSLVTARTAVPRLDQLPTDAENVTYYAIFTFAATPLGLLYVLWRAKMRETIWDRVFFSSSICLHLYVLTLVGFILTAAVEAATQTSTVNIVGRLLGNPVVVATFWIILFSTPPVLLNIPIGFAAHVEKHGFKGAYPQHGPLAFIMASAAATYILMRLTAFVGNVFIVLVIGTCAVLLILSWLTLSMQLIAQRSGLGWLIIAAAVTAGVAVATQTLGV